MKPFMSNTCGHPHCMTGVCQQCFYYTPRAFGIRVPRWLGIQLYKFERKLNKEVKLYDYE